MLTIDELHFPDPADPAHVEAAQIVDQLHRRLRFVQRIIGCTKCEQTIESTLVCAGFARGILLDHAGLSLDDIRAMTKGKFSC